MDTVGIEDEKQLNPVERNGRVCATWADASSEVVQEGLAVRIEPQPSGSLRLVTVTKNPEETT